MSSRAEALGRYVACALAPPLAALAADPVGQFQPTQMSLALANAMPVLTGKRYRSLPFSA